MVSRSWGYCSSSRLSSSSPSVFSAASKTQSIGERERNLIWGPTNREILPHINYIVRTCLILFLQHEKLESVGLISKGLSGASYSTIISILPCIYLFTIHIGICSECNKNGSGLTLHKFEKLGDIHQNTLQQSIWYD